MNTNGVVDSVELEVAVELGSTAMTVDELLRLAEGSVIELAKPVGEEVEMLVNGSPVAKGDVVVVEGALGFRVSRMVIAQDQEAGSPPL
jgi:flagellar motor switch protein FliN/FliY